jgi:hypothetical protein
MSIPDSSRKTIAAFRRVAFFYSRPVLLDPGTNALLIALDGASRGLLWREPQAMQHTTDMRGVIPHAEAALNQPTHPRTGPQVRGQPRNLRTLDEHPTQAREVAATQAPRPT